MIKTNKWDNILFQRRYVHILIQWVKLIPKSKFMVYYNFILENLNNTQDYVLIYEQCSCIHEMLKEIDYWLKMSSGSGQNNYGSMLQVAYKGSSSDSTSLRKAPHRTNDLYDFDQKNNDSSDDQIHMS